MAVRDAFLFKTVLLVAMALSLSAEATNLSQGARAVAPATKPAILIYWQPGMQPETTDHLDVAVWESGRIMWRAKSPDYEKHGNGWRLSKGTVYEGAIAPQKVAEALTALRSKGVFKVKDWGYLIPDASCTVICVRFEKNRLRIGSSIIPPKAPPHGTSQPTWTKGRDAWFLIRQVARALIPTKGREIPEPQDIWMWANI